MKKLLSRNFCNKTVAVKFRNFHTVHTVHDFHTVLWTFFEKSFVKATFLLKKLLELESWLHEIYRCWLEARSEMDFQTRGLVWNQFQAKAEAWNCYRPRVYKIYFWPKPTFNNFIHFDISMYIQKIHFCPFHTQYSHGHSMMWNILFNESFDKSFISLNKTLAKRNTLKITVLLILPYFSAIQSIFEPIQIIMHTFCYHTSTRF